MSAPASQTATATSVPLRILYAEDVRELRELARMILTPLGHTLECAENGLQAWERVRLAPDAFDLIITDHHMPKMNGLQFVKLVRTLSFRGKILVFSSDLNTGTALLYRQLDVSCILHKPIMPKVLRQVIAELCAPVDAPMTATAGRQSKMDH